MTLTPKQEAFAKAYVETGNASEAYRQAYAPKKMSESAIKVEASRLLKHPNVALTLEQIQAEARDRHGITVDTIVDMLLEDRKMAHTNRQAGSAVAASMGLAKICGYLVDKKQVSGDDENPLVTRVELVPVVAKQILEELDGIAGGGPGNPIPPNH